MAFVSALVDRRGPDRHRRPGHRAAALATSSPTRSTRSPPPARPVGDAYVALFQGAIFNPTLAANGTLTGYLYPLSETLVNATPLIVGGLSVGLAFRAGLFNIGGQGQIIIGAIFAGYVGFHWHLPAGST